MSYPLLLSKYLNTPLLVTPALANAAMSLLTGTASPSALSTKTDVSDSYKMVEQRGNVAILNITGPIFRYGQVEACSMVYGTQHFGEAFAELEKDPSVEHIVINFDTGGGEAPGIGEFAQQIRDSKTPTTAYVDGMAASAGYWLATACDRIVAHETSLLGSVGVVYLLADTTKLEEKIGVERIEIVSAVSPKKRPDIKSEEGRGQIQVLADDLADIFVKNIAGYRGLSELDVKNDFGQGDVMIASKALKAGMVDEIGTFEALLSELQGETMADKKKTHQAAEVKTEATVTTKPAAQPAADTQMTAEQLQAQHPALYAEVMKEGAAAERARIQAVYAERDPHYAALTEEHMFNGTSNVESFVFALHQAKKATVETHKENFYTSGDKTAETLREVSTTINGGEDEVKADNPLKAAAQAVQARQNKGAK